MRKNILLGGLLLSSFLSAKPVEILVLGSSDVHGRVVPWSYASDREDFSGSYAQISSLVRDYRQKYQNVIVVDAGDAMQDNLIERFIDVFPHPIALTLNQIGYDVFVPGNHEFNFGLTVLNRMLGMLNGHVLLANVNYKESEKPYQQGSVIIERAGIKLGFIGVTTPMTMEFEKKTGNVDSLNFTSPTEAVRREVENLKDKVDAIVVVAHLGLENENEIPDTSVTDIAEAVDGIDVIIAGHAHKNINKAVVNGAFITEPYRYGASLSIANFTFDSNTKEMLKKDTKTISVNNKKSDEKIENLYKKFHHILRAESNQIIGETPIDLVQKEAIHGIPAIYMKDTGLTSLFNDAQLYYSPANVVSILIDNPNAKIEKGQIRRKDIANNYQYTNGETTVYEFTGKDLKDYMEWSAAYFSPAVSGQNIYHFDPVRSEFKYMTYDIFGGVRYEIDLTQPVGSRIINLRFPDETPITNKTPIKMGMNAYRYAMLIKENGPLAGRKHKVIWDSQEAFGENEGTIRYRIIDYISNVKKGKIDGKSHDYWHVL